MRGLQPVPVMARTMTVGTAAEAKPTFCRPLCAWIQQCLVALNMASSPVSNRNTISGWLGRHAPTPLSLTGGSRHLKLGKRISHFAIYTT